MTDNNFILFKDSEINCTIPTQLVSVFNEDVHPLAKLASEKLQDYISERSKVDLNFKLNHGNDTKKIGKMFGVLVVENEHGEIGYLQAFSGKLGNSNHHKKFVPPIFDLLDPNNFFNQGMSEITVLTNEINDFKNSSKFIDLQVKVKNQTENIKLQLSALSDEKSRLKQMRKAERVQAKAELSEEDLKKVEIELAKKSVELKAKFKVQEFDLKSKLTESVEEFSHYSDRLKVMIEFRKIKSSNLQQQLFDEYKFVNHSGEIKLLRNIFNDPKGFKMPAGAGECSAPKLFQYAFLNSYKPIALAEFWWGKSPKSENKVHTQYYPPCTDKCVPILGYMLG